MKVLLSPLFQFPIPWLPQYIARFNTLGPGWRHLLFTDVETNLYATQPSRFGCNNVVGVPMTAEEFATLTHTTTGVKPYVPAPSSKFGDCRPAFGEIFQDWLSDCEWWGHTDMDVVLGRLDHFLTDNVLDRADIFSTDPNAVNGVFTLYRNTPAINRLYRRWHGWPTIFVDPVYHAFDEREFSALCRRDHGKTIGQDYCLRFDHHAWQERATIWQEHDGQPDHWSRPKLALDAEGRLLNTLTDKEMMFFHFKRTKPTWPLGG